MMKNFNSNLLSCSFHFQNMICSDFGIGDGGQNVEEPFRVPSDNGRLKPSATELAGLKSCATHSLSSLQLPVELFVLLDDIVYPDPCLVIEGLI